MRRSREEDLRDTITRHHDGAGLEIAADEPLMVDGREAAGDVNADGQRLVDRERTADADVQRETCTTQGQGLSFGRSAPSESLPREVSGLAIVGFPVTR